jgi:osmotically-inducible protein OsmY
LCEKVAKGVRGVLDLNNNISIDYSRQRSDGELEMEIRQVLRWDNLVDHALIDVEVNDGTVSLSGTVGSAAEKRLAHSDAWVMGVKSVDDSGLQVARWARNEDLRQNKYVARSVEEIEEAIQDALLYDPRVLAANVTPEVVGSTVTLRGAVDNLKAKRAAEQVARNTVGVRYVTNRLKVRPGASFSDEQLEQDIQNAILRNPYVDRFEIAVRVENGIAFLSGSVDSYFEKSKADDIASSVRGVVAVRNNLDVDEMGPLAYEPYVDDDYIYGYDWFDYSPGRTFKPDKEIREDIRSELWWSPFVDSEDVTVEVEDGVATLTGSVDSWSEWGAATENAYEGGAVWVDNDLQVW